MNTYFENIQLRLIKEKKFNSVIEILILHCIERQVNAQ